MTSITKLVAWFPVAFSSPTSVANLERTGAIFNRLAVQGRKFACPPGEDGNPLAKLSYRANHSPMKHLLSTLLGSLVLISSTGCEGMRFSKYEGPVTTWPTGSAFTDKVFEVPVYRGWPEKPYDVLGYVEFTNPNIDWNQGDMKQAARTAKETGGDAIILMPKADIHSPTSTTTRTQLGITGNQTVAVVVKWK